MNSGYVAAMIAAIAAVTIILRFLPFLVFHNNKKTPDFILYLGSVLPYAIMGMLVVYCLKGISFAVAPFGLPEIIAGFLVVLLHVWKRNTLISITAGTVCYMLLIQTVFS